MISIKNLNVIYRTGKTVHHAVRGIDLEIGPGEFYTLLGPSGCGKTTTLRTIAGLERPDSGFISVGSDAVFDSEAGIFVEPNDRNIGMVFQSYAIWPHMTAFQNVAFPLRHMRPRPDKAEIRNRVLHALALVKLHGLEDRPAPFLSGGQQQRLALARALVFEPRALLLDEPLSNLDAKLREDMRQEIAELVKRLKITTLFVTHEQIEALTMSDRIGIMRDGVIVQEGGPRKIYEVPHQRFAAEFIGKMNVIAGTFDCAGANNGRAKVDTPVGNLIIQSGVDAPHGANVLLAIRPENVRLAAADTVVSNRLEGIVERSVFLGNTAESIVAVGNTKLRLQTHPHAMPDIGARVSLTVEPADIQVMLE